MAKQLNDFLESQSFLYDRIKLGIDVYPSDSELEEFARLAKEYAPDQVFDYHSCKECRNALISFVYLNYNKPKEEPLLTSKKK